MLKRFQEVFIVGRARGEQVVRKGHVPAFGRSAPWGGKFEISVDPPVDPEGWTGAPVLDARGHLVGILLGATDDIRDSEGRTTRLSAEKVLVDRIID